MNIYFLYLTCSYAFYQGEKKRRKQKTDEKLYIAEKYLYMNDIQYLETEQQKKLSLTIELPRENASVLFVPQDTDTHTHIDESLLEEV